MSRLSKDEKLELEQLRREKANKIKKPYVDKLCDVTGEQPTYYQDWTLEELKEGVDIVQRVRMGRSGINPGSRGRGATPMYNGVEDVGFGYEHNPITGEWKRVVLRPGEKAW